MVIQQADRPALRRGPLPNLRSPAPCRRYDEAGGVTYRTKQSVTLFAGDTLIKQYFDTDNGGTATLRQR
jgi:hypothetical protein